MTVAAPVREETWQSVVARYREASAVKALLHTAAGVVPLVVCWTGMAWAWNMPYGKVWGLLLALPAGAMLVRLFAIQHDCGHGALFSQGWANDLLGRLLAPFVMTPYTQWAREHAKHHATSGRLEFRGVGDVDTWTVAEYRAAAPWKRFLYRVMRHPLFLFGPGATGYFLFVQRWVRFQPERRDAWVSVWGTNAVMAAYIAAGCWWLGTARFFWMWLPAVAFASGLGTWIFYIGHQYADTYWEKEEDWDFFTASMRGSSFYRPGALLDFATCDIGYHHIHHLASRIPFYNLRKAYRENAMFHVKPLTLRESLRCANLALWDEDKKRLVPFT